MASRIKGITIEIDGNTKPLESALKHVNSSLSKTQSSLRDVERLLKLDPGNVELLSQKQRLLGEAIEGTEEKLKALKEAGKQAQIQLEKGELGQDKYDALQREIIKTENSLESLKAQAKATDTSLKNSSTGLEKMGNDADKAGDKLSGLSKGSGALIGATAALLPATEELNRDLSFLEQNAKNANVGMGTMEKAFKTFNAVSGETDSSVEAVSNLLQAGFTESNLQKAVEGVSGAMSRFPDTLKIESLADSIQETVATGKSIGQFGEYLDRVGIGAANFDEQLAGCETTAEKTDLVLQALASGGAQDAYEAWEKGNKGLKEYEDSTLEMQMALADLAEEIAPLAADIIDFAKEGVEAFNSLPKPVKALAGGMAGLAAVSSPVLKGYSNITSALPKFTGGLKGATTASKAAAAGSKLLNASLLTNPYVLAAGAATALGVAIYKIVSAQNAEIKAVEKSIEKRNKNIESVERSADKTQIYFERLKELEGIEGKTTAQKEEMKTIVDQLNESVDNLNLSYDEEADKLNQTTQALENKIKASKDAALAEAYGENAAKAYEEYQKQILKLVEAEDQLAEKEKNLSRFTVKTGEQYKTASKQYETAKEKVDELRTSTNMLWRDYTKNSNEAFISSGQWDTLVADAEAAGVKIPKGLMKGIESGKYMIPTTVEELESLISFQTTVNKAKKAGIDIPNQITNGLTNGNLSVQEATSRLNDVIDFQKAATEAGQDGTKLVNNLSSKIASGEMTAKQATTKLTKSVDGELDSTASGAGGKGKTTSSNYASGVKGGKEKARSAGKDLGEAAKSGAGSVSLHKTGKNMGSGLAGGLRAAIEEVAGAAAEIANAALNAAKKASKTHSPSKRWDEELGQMDGAGYEKGLLKSIPKVRAAGTALSDAAFSGAGTAKNPFDGFTIAQPPSRQIDYGKISGAVKSANREIFTGQERQTEINQTVNIYQPVETPYETARAIKNMATFGLAGAGGVR